MRIGAWFFLTGIAVACGGEFTNATNGGSDAGSGGGSGSSGASGSGSGTGSRASATGGKPGTVVPGVGGSDLPPIGETGGGSSSSDGSVGVPPSNGGSDGGTSVPPIPGSGGVATSTGGASQGGSTGGTTGNPVDSGACRVSCSDGTCSHLAWDFESGTLEGISGPNMSAMKFNDTYALGVEVGQLNTGSGISVMLPVCNSGNVDLHSKTLSFRVYFDGTPASQYAFYVQAAIPSGAASEYLSQIGAGTGEWTPFSAPLATASSSNAITKIELQIGSLGGAFSGIIWIDDIRIQ